MGAAAADNQPGKRPSLLIVGQGLVGEQISGARSDDLVFAVTGYVGSGASWVANTVVEKLEAAQYRTQLIKVTSLIADVKARLGEPLDLRDATRLQRSRRMQDAGDSLRKKFGSPFMAGLGIRDIYNKRQKTEVNQAPVAFVIDSLKHPDEVEALRSVYGNAFYLVSVVCRRDERRKRLKIKYKGDPLEQVDDLMSRDEEGDVAHGQRVRRTLHRGDFFVTNDDPDTAKSGLGEQALSDSIERFLRVVLGREVIRPTRHEKGMYAAWAASLRSSCLSRQVGAAVLDEHGAVIATGTNDVPRYGGGLYQDGDEIDNRCFKWSGELARSSGPQCHNDTTKKEIYQALFEKLVSKGLLTKDTTPELVKAAIEQTRVRDLIEFSRAVHAEMDALLSIARTGGSTSRGGSLYCTTKPCHSCARHIVAAGIKRVFYIEPYEKSMAADLHRDSIIEPSGSVSEISDKVTFELFSGVAPRRFARLFEKRGPLKDGGGTYTGPSRTEHYDPVLIKTFRDFEKDIAYKIDALASQAAPASEDHADE